MELYTPSLQMLLQQVEAALPTYLPSAETRAGVTAQAMAYACEGGGKRIRPVLVLEWMRLCQGDVQAAMPFACALEMIHSYSLIHDDLPCMDNSPLRRGKPSTHAAFGETTALLAGDALLNRAFEVCLAPGNRKKLQPENVLQATYLLADAAGYNGMIGGQTIDCLSEGRLIDRETLEELDRKKTGALLVAACRLGARLAGADEELFLAAGEYGRHLGLCFQIVDDLLDATSTAEQLGKPVGADEENQKSTYVTLLGVEQAADQARLETEAAITALAPLGEEADNLACLAKRLLTRLS